MLQIARAFFVEAVLRLFDQAKSMMKNMMGGMKGGKMKRMMNRFGKP